MLQSQYIEPDSCREWSLYMHPTAHLFYEMGEPYAAGLFEHPEKYPDLIIRVDGYSDYFRNLSPALRKAVVERNIHKLG